MAATTIDMGWWGRARSFAWLLTATVLLAAIGACRDAGVQDEARLPDGAPAPPDAGPTTAAESPDGSPSDEAPSSVRVMLNGEELPPELAAAFLQVWPCGILISYA